jgi:phosphate transport system substrate-binding protein
MRVTIRVFMCAVATLFLSVSVAGADGVKIGGTGAAQGLLDRLAQAYMSANPDHRVEAIPGLGSSGAISAVSAGALDIAISGRALKPEEESKGLSIRPFLDTPYMFVTSHPTTQKLTSAEVVAVFGGTLNKWSDGKEIRPILRPRSDAASVFLLESFAGLRASMDKLRQRPDIPVAATDQDNSDAAQRTPNSFAGMTLLQFSTERPRLRPVWLDGLEASLSGMESGNYPLKMRLSLVWNSRPNQAASKFLAFLNSPEADKIIREAGGSAIHAP